MTLSLDSLDFSSLAPRPSLRRAQPGKVVATDWAWMLKQAAESDTNVPRTLLKWDYQRGKIAGPDRWKRIRPGMEAFVHRRLYTVTEAEVIAAIAETAPPLGGTTSVDRAVGNVNDATPAAPFNLMLHKLLETLDRVPLWQDFERYHREHPSVYLEDIAKHTGIPLDVFLGDWLAHPVARAVRYRLGTAYNSFIREVHFLASMSGRHGINLSHHFMLDAVWKIDFLYGQTAIELYLANSDYKHEDGGRKLKCVDVNPSRDVLEVAFGERHDAGSYDKPWLIDDETILTASDSLRSGDVDHRRLPKFFA
jgi:hypothetical protein